MTAVNISSILGDIDKYKYNPTLMQRASLESLRAINDGTIEIVDATNPFIWCIENTTVNVTGFMLQSEALLRRQYAAAAVTPEDLYYHMSDKDYIGRFALPSKATFTLLFDKDELYNALVLDPATNIEKITIPRNTMFSVAGVNFSIQYPIDIRRLSHGSLQVVYIADKLSPLLTLSTNDLITQEITLNGKTFIQFDIEALQFDIYTRYNNITAASGFKTSIPLKDSFYFARVYMQNNDKSWTELETTHNLQIYDPTVPTAVIQVFDTRVDVSIPIIYTTTGKVRNALRIDIYQTKGDLTLPLINYSFADFSAKWIAIDATESNEYVAALLGLKTILFYSRSVVSGGRGALSFNELRSRVIQNNVGPQITPITNIQLQSSIEDNGYDVIKNIDTITNRIFLATKLMPKPADERLITAAASGVSTVVLSFNECALAQGAIVHNNAVTLTPEALYLNDNGITKLVTITEYAALQALTGSQKCVLVNSSNYFYSPFHYVLDATSTNFNVRPYYLDSPEILSKSFIQENAETGFQASVDQNFQIEKTTTGYRLTLQTISNDAFKALPDNQVFCQLSFKTPLQPIASFMVGVQAVRDPSAERVFVFEMTSNFNLDSNDSLDQTAFSFSPTPLATNSSLLQVFDIFFATSSTVPANLKFTDIDNSLGKFQLPTNTVGITHEQMKIRFGYSLNTLWSQARSVLSSVPYKTYATNVPNVYLEDVYNINPVTGSAFTVDGNGTIQYTYLHRKNNPVLDSQGNPLFLHLAGEPQLDNEGNPIPEDGYQSQMIRNVDITMIEGAYRFATDSVAADYRKLISSSLVSWLTNDLVNLNSNLLDQTKIYFYPKQTQGDIRIISKDGIESKIPAGQSFVVTLHITEEADKNSKLKENLIKTTIKTIDSSIKNLTTAVSTIEYALKNQYGSDVIGVKLNGLGGSADFNTITILDGSNRLSIKKILVAQPDNQLIVTEDVTVEFIRHSIIPKVTS